MSAVVLLISAVALVVTVMGCVLAVARLGMMHFSLLVASLAVAFGFLDAVVGLAQVRSRVVGGMRDVIRRLSAQVRFRIAGGISGARLFEMVSTRIC